tara:strand:+ start:199 stop:435 length:237 start_codon:yes stop_codon:yes gene_type:complete
VEEKVYELSLEEVLENGPLTALELVGWLVRNMGATDEEIRARYARLGEGEIAQLDGIMEHTLNPLHREKVTKVTGHTP